MNDPIHKKCYGTMMPRGEHPHHSDGKVFKLMKSGTVGLARRTLLVETNLAEWDDCRACEEFAHCYQLCTARIALEGAISSEE